MAWLVASSVSLGVVILLLTHWLTEQVERAEPALVEATSARSDRLPPVLLDNELVADVQPIVLPEPTDSGVSEPGEPEDAPAPVFPPGSGSLALVVVWGDDGSHAADVGVDVRGDGVPSHVPPVVARTDATGWLRVDGLPPGDAVVRGDRGGQVTVTIRPQETAEATLELPVGIQVHGVVLDPKGRPVPGADIWLSAAASFREGQVVTQTEPDGRFSLRSVQRTPWRILSARSKSWGPSGVAEIRATESSRVEVTLRLSPPGGDVVVRVTDHDGEPIQGASILLGGDYGWFLEADEFQTDLSRRVPPRPGISDQHGVAIFEGIPPGSVSVYVRAPRYAPGYANDEVTSGHQTESLVSLRPGATLTGRVLAMVEGGDNWVGVPGVRVTGVPEDSIAHPGDFEEVVVTSGEDGVWVMDDLDPYDESIVLTATHDVYGQASREEELVEGTQRKLDLRLTRGPEIRGQVVDEFGVPRVGWRVVAMDVYNWNSSTETDASGHFLIGNAETVAHSLMVFRPEPPNEVPLLVREDVFPDHEPVMLVVGKDELPSAMIVLSLADPDGELVSNAMIAVIPKNERAATRAIETRVPGHYRTELLPPGEYDLRVWPSRFPFLLVEDLVVAADEQLDLGELKLSRGGRILVHLTSTPQLEDITDYWVSISSHDGTREVSIGITEDSWETNPLEPGTYGVSLEGDGMADEVRTVVVRADETTELSVQLEPGVECAFSLHGLDGSATVAAYEHRTLWSRYLTFEVVDENGGLVVQHLKDLDRSIAEQWYREFEIGLRPGRYTAQVKVGGVTIAETAFEVVAGAESSSVVRLDATR